MDIRNILEKKKENKTKQIRISILMLFILWILATLIFLIHTENTKIIYNIWDHVSVRWELLADDNYPTNTHKVFDWKTTFGIKSSSMNLNNFLWEYVEFEWDILWINWNHPIIHISSIKLPNEKLIVSENKYFFTQDLISFDFSKENEIYAKKKW